MKEETLKVLTGHKIASAFSALQCYKEGDRYGYIQETFFGDVIESLISEQPTLEKCSEESKIRMKTLDYLEHLMKEIESFGDKLDYRVLKTNKVLYHSLRGAQNALDLYVMERIKEDKNND